MHLFREIWRFYIDEDLGTFKMRSGKFFCFVEMFFFGLEMWFYLHRPIHRLQAQESCYIESWIHKCLVESFERWSHRITWFLMFINKAMLILAWTWLSLNILRLINFIFAMIDIWLMMISKSCERSAFDIAFYIFFEVLSLLSIVDALSGL